MKKGRGKGEEKHELFLVPRTRKHEETPLLQKSILLPPAREDEGMGEYFSLPPQPQPPRQRVGGKGEESE